MHLYCRVLNKLFSTGQLNPYIINILMPAYSTVIVGESQIREKDQVVGSSKV